MKKILCFIISLSLVLSSFTVAYAKQGGSHEQKGKKQSIITQQDKHQENDKTIKTDKTDKTDKGNKGKAYGKKQSFKINGSPVIKYGKYVVPIKPITKGMGAIVSFDKTTGILNVTKDATVIVINFKDKTVTVNGVADTTSVIFSAKSDKAKQVLKYIADKLGVRITFGKDKIDTEAPLDVTAPTITGITSATYSVSGSAITVNVTGAGAVNDKVDVKKLSVTDTALNKTYQLTDSTGVVTSETALTINLSAADVLGLNGFGSTTVFLNIAAGSLLSDKAGNVSVQSTAVQTIPVTITQ